MSNGPEITPLRHLWQILHNWGSGRMPARHATAWAMVQISQKWVTVHYGLRDQAPAATELHYRPFHLSGRSCLRSPPPFPAVVSAGRGEVFPSRRRRNHNNRPHLSAANLTAGDSMIRKYDDAALRPLSVKYSQCKSAWNGKPLPIWVAISCIMAQIQPA